MKEQKATYSEKKIKHLKRDASVELCRIIACLIVVGCHTYLPTVVEGCVDRGRLYIACLLADGVAIFWMITGFFIFQNNDYKKLLRHTATRIVIPMVFISIVMFYMDGWLIGGMSFSESVGHSVEDYKNIFFTLLRWKNPISHLGHFWYLYVYLMIILIFPLLRSAVLYVDADKEHIKWFMILSFAFLIVNDITKNELAAFSHHSINALIPACIEMMWGHILYEQRDRIKKNIPFLFVYCGGFLALNAVRFMIQYKRYEMNASNESILYWYSSIGLLCAICVIAACFILIQNNKDNFMTRIVCCLGSYTMAIYMIHPIVKNVLNNHKVQSHLQKWIIGEHTSVVYESIYTIVILFCVFVISLMIAMIIKYIITLIKPKRSRSIGSSIDV